MYIYNGGSASLQEYNRFKAMFIFEQATLNQKNG